MSSEIDPPAGPATEPSLSAAEHRELVAIYRVAKAVALAVLLVLIYTFFRASHPQEMPGCDAARTISTVESMAAPAMTSATATPLTRGRSANDNLAAPRLRQVRQVGYASAPRQRGCAGTFVMGNETLEFAYVIAPHPTDAELIAIMGADPAIVEARFSHVDTEGNFTNTAAPLGRVNLEKAMRDGVDALRKDNPMYRPGAHTVTSLLHPAPRDVNPDRQREIADVEPIGSCVPDDARRQYACTMLIERNDPMLAALGMQSSQNMTAVFNFEQDPGAREWRVSSDFGERYATAVIESRSVHRPRPSAQ